MSSWADSCPIFASIALISSGYGLECKWVAGSFFRILYIYIYIYSPLLLLFLPLTYLCFESLGREFGFIQFRFHVVYLMIQNGDCSLAFFDSAPHLVYLGFYVYIYISKTRETITRAETSRCEHQFTLSLPLLVVERGKKKTRQNKTPSPELPPTLMPLISLSLS